MIERFKQMFTDKGRDPIVWPVGRGAVIQSVYGDRETQSEILRAQGLLIAPHSGFDITHDGDPSVYATEEGSVCYATSGHKTFGKCFAFCGLSGKILFYAHLSSAPPPRGKKCMPGERLGTMGDTGLSKGVHLHFQVHTYFNPQSFGYLDPKVGGHIDPALYLPSFAASGISLNRNTVKKNLTGGLSNIIPKDVLDKASYGS